jgi:hypothetical protein
MENFWRAYCPFSRIAGTTLRGERAKQSANDFHFVALAAADTNTDRLLMHIETCATGVY